VVVQTDYSGLSQVGAPIVAPAKRVVVTPAREGDRAQEDRRQQQNQNSSKDGKSVFRTLLSEATLAGLNAASSKAENRSDPTDSISKSAFIRVEKRPESGPDSIGSDQTNDLFSYIADKRRNAEAVQREPEQQQSVPLQQAFIDATSRYTEQAVAAANVFAGRGETLELQA